MQFCINYTRTMSGSQFPRIRELIIVVFPNPFASSPKGSLMKFTR